MSNKSLQKNWVRFLPAVMFMAIIALLWTGLHKDNISTSYAAEKQYFPEFSLMDIKTNKKVTLKELKGKPFVVHIWASWCGNCIQEHPTWVSLKKKHNFPLVGVVYRDSPEKVKVILSKKGNPYNYLLSDASGALGLELGIAGVPATYVVDKNGKIVFTQFGDISSKKFEKSVLPLLKK